MRVAVTGAAGRLGTALVQELRGEPGVTVLPWDRASFDLDAPGDVGALVEQTRPDAVIHAAAWTDVDGCAREPELAMERNGIATSALASACGEWASSLIVVSTNEVFPGTRQDRKGYRSDDPTAPANPYGESKLAGEEGARRAFAAMPRQGSASRARLGIVRTAWLFGPGKPDFPARIVAAAEKASAEGHALRVVADEVGNPTYIPDLAGAIAALLRDDFEGVHHVVNAGSVSRADWARDVLARLGADVHVEDITLDDYVRPSRPPRWGVLEPTTLPGGPLRDWRQAMTERADQMLEVSR